MAQKVRIILEDDLDGGPADETVRFGLDGGQYEIDLSNANAARLRDAIVRVEGSPRTEHFGVRPCRSWLAWRSNCCEAQPRDRCYSQVG